MTKREGYLVLFQGVAAQLHLCVSLHRSSDAVEPLVSYILKVLFLHLPPTPSAAAAVAFLQGTLVTRHSSPTPHTAISTTPYHIYQNLASCMVQIPFPIKPLFLIGMSNSPRTTAFHVFYWPLSGEL